MLHISKLKSYKNNAAEQNEQIKRLNNEILELVQDEKFDNEMNNTSLFNHKIYDLVSRIEICLPLPSTTNSANSSAGDLDTVSYNPQNNHDIDAKLPKIEIPKFNGKLNEWQSFWISFLQRLTVKQIYPMLLNLYLKGVLSKDFQESIHGLLITNENYGIAVKILRER